MLRRRFIRGCATSRRCAESRTSENCVFIKCRSTTSLRWNNSQTPSEQEPENERFEYDGLKLSGIADSPVARSSSPTLPTEGTEPDNG